MHLVQRPRRNRRTQSIRDLVSETRLHSSDLVLPLFVQEGKNKKTAISSLKNHYRLSMDLVVKEAKEAWKLGLKAIALFPVIPNAKKDRLAKEAMNRDGLLPKTIREVKNKVPGITVISDVAMDPYSSDGHDGVVKNKQILNDPTLEILSNMALVQADAGADYVAPSDMMDGRVGFIRKTLDQNGFKETGILSYAAKYASSFYGPFRDALDSAPKSGDKKTYQMDPANVTEALREVELDIKEGADIVMVKPALPYLDVIQKIKERFSIPVAAYQVSGEYAMIHSASQKNQLDLKLAMLETLISIRRAGAKIIFTYFAKEAAKALN